LPLTYDKLLFKQLAKLGKQLVKLHLMETAIEGDSRFPIAGNHVVEKIVYHDEKVYINKTQYFDAVKPEIWKFHVGGYQVCEKWLKTRKGRALNSEECLHYLYILAAIAKTLELMIEIDIVIGKFPLD
jgi:exoribonuclease II